MKVFYSEDLKTDLGKIVKEVVKYYESDFVQDIKIFSKADAGTVFVWIARTHGTDCMFEEDAWADNVWGNSQCHAHLKEKESRVYFVKIGSKDGCLDGFIYPLNREAFFEDIKKNTVGIKNVISHSEVTEDSIVSFTDYNKNAFAYHEQWNKAHNGKYRVLYEPLDCDKYKHEKIMSKYKTERETAKSCPISELI